MRALAALGLALALTIAAGCRTARAPILGTGPLGEVDGRLFADAVLAAQSAGYHALEVDASTGRFEVLARNDGRGVTHFVVQCFADGWVSIVPVGPTVIETEDGRLEMPTRLRDEYAAFAEELDRTITLVR